MARTKFGHSWIERHLNDPFVKAAQKQGYRSRASFKLIELQNKDKLFRQGMSVVDLGAAPGGWSQVLVQQLGKNGKVISMDKLDMDPIPGVVFIQGDFSEQEPLERLQAALAKSPLDWVVSDISPNLSGVMSVDQPKLMELAELAFHFAQMHLKEGGGLLVKVFQGEGFEGFIKTLRQSFAKVVVRKPDASRLGSRELYVLARGYYNIENLRT